MTYQQFIKTTLDAEKNFRSAIVDFPEHDDFLSKCYLVISRNSRQFAFKQKLSLSDVSERQLLLNDTVLKDRIVSLTASLKKLLQLQSSAKNKQDALTLSGKISKIKDELHTIPLDQLEFHDDFDIEVIFPSVNMEVIQKLKAHPLVNKSKTCLCKACIRVFFY